jgi:hypothetical protein
MSKRHQEFNIAIPRYSKSEKSYTISFNQLIPLRFLAKRASKLTTQLLRICNISNSSIQGDLNITEILKNVIAKIGILKRHLKHNNPNTLIFAQPEDSSNNKNTSLNYP